LLYKYKSTNTDAEDSVRCPSTQFTRFTSTKVQILTPSTQFTRFTSTKAQILTAKDTFPGAPQQDPHATATPATPATPTDNYSIAPELTGKIDQAVARGLKDSSAALRLAGIVEP
jgi:hypothetical protein